MSLRETLLIALHGVVVATAESVAGASAVVTRNEALTERLDDVNDVWLNLLDGGSDGEPQAVMGSPPAWEFDHTARIEIYVAGADATERDARFEIVVTALSEAISADETLSGLCDYVEPQSVEEPSNDVLGLTIGFKTGILPVLLMYDAPTRAG